MTPVDIEAQFGALTPHRQGHSLRVGDLMAKLAVRYGLDVEDAQWAGRYHDIAREMSRPDLLAEAERLGLQVDPQERREPVLLHGPVAAVWLQQAGLGHPEAWDAIRFHTTAGPGLSPLGRALFVADGVEPGRSFATRRALEDLALKNLDRGYYALLRETVEYLKTRGLLPHPRMLEALTEDPIA